LVASGRSWEAGKPYLLEVPKHQKWVFLLQDGFGRKLPQYSKFTFYYILY
jgi:hypothetical protein